MMETKRMQEILEKSHYQTFDFLEGDRKDSNSGEKYRLSKLDAFDLNNLSCLDVGCNAGYFLFRMLQKNPRRLVGIDIGEKFIDVANTLNREVFGSNIITFICRDFFRYYFGEKFDMVICFSSFHYFGDNQEVFFELCYGLMNKQGILLLEVEEYPFNDISIVNRDVRPADKKKYHYPNNLKLREYILGKFNIIDRYISIKQGGSLYDRYFYVLQKV